MVLSIGIKLQLSAWNSLTIVPPNYPMFVKVWKFIVFPFLSKIILHGPLICLHASPMLPGGRHARSWQNGLGSSGTDSTWMGEKRWKEGSLGSRDTWGGCTIPALAFRWSPASLFPRLFIHLSLATTPAVPCAMRTFTSEVKTYV